MCRSPFVVQSKAAGALDQIFILIFNRPSTKTYLDKGVRQQWVRALFLCLLMDTTQAIGLKPPKGTRCHITGTDLVRHSWPASLNPAKGSSRR